MRYRLSRLCLKPLHYLGRMALRVMITALIFTACLVVVSRFLGLPVPGLHELLDRFEGVSKLGKVLS